MFFSACTDWAKMDSRRASDSLSALAAWPKSSKVFLRGAGVWAMMPRVTGSSFSVPPQSGQVMSKGWSLKPMGVVPF